MVDNTMKKIFLLMMIALLFVQTPADASLFGFKGITSKKRIRKVDDVKEQRRVVLVEIYAKWCPLCKNIQPTLDLLAKEVSDIEIVQLDVSNKEKAEESEKKAKGLNIRNYYLANKNKTGSVGVLVGSTREVVTVLYNSNDMDEYKQAIQKAKTIEKNLENKTKEKIKKLKALYGHKVRKNYSHHICLSSLAK